MLNQSTKYPNVPQVDARCRQATSCHATRKQAYHLDIRLETGMAIDLSANLQGLTCVLKTTGHGVHNAAAVTQAHHAVAVKQMGVNAGHLRGHVRAQTKTFAAELVHQLESTEIKVAPATSQ